MSQPAIAVADTRHVPPINKRILITALPMNASTLLFGSHHIVIGLYGPDGFYRLDIR
jgi:hypothetical protein